jgi:hypothetical protein
MTVVDLEFDGSDDIRDRDRPEDGADTESKHECATRGDRQADRPVLK